MGEGRVPFSIKWLSKQVKEGGLPAVGVDPNTLGRTWSAWTEHGEEQEPKRSKNVVSLSDYKKVEVKSRKMFLLGKSMSKEQRGKYVALLKEYLYVFA